MAGLVRPAIACDPVVAAVQEGIAVPTGGTVLDVGANIGLFTLHLLLDTHHHSQRQQEQQRRHTQGAEQAQQPRQLASAGLHGPTGKGPLPGGPPSLTQSGPLTGGGQVSNTSEGGGHGREDCSSTAALSSGRGPVQVWAFEPVPDIWGVLVHNLRAHGLEGRVSGTPWHAPACGPPCWHTVPGLCGTAARNAYELHTLHQLTQ